MKPNIFNKTHRGLNNRKVRQSSASIQPSAVEISFSVPPCHIL